MPFRRHAGQATMAKIKLLCYRFSSSSSLLIVFAVGRQKSTAPTSTAVVSNRPDRGRLFGRKFGRNLTIFFVKLARFHGKIPKFRKNYEKMLIFGRFRSFFRPVGQNRPTVGRQKIDRDRPTSTDREH